VVQSELVVINHSSVKGSNGPMPLATRRGKRKFHIQIKLTANIIDPGDTLQAQIILAQRIDRHGGHAFLDGLLEDIRLRYLDEGRVDGRRFRQGSVGARRIL